MTNQSEHRLAARDSRLIALYFATVAVYADMYITQPILPELSREFGIPPPTAGLSVSAVVLAIGIFTYLPYYLIAPPFNLSTGLVSSAYLVYLAGIVASPLAGRLSTRISRRIIMGAGLIIALLGVAGTLVQYLPLIVASLFVLVIGMFTAQGTAPAYVNDTARTAKGGANALYLAFYYIGGTLGSSLPGYALQAFNWPGVVAFCAAMLLLALLADWLLCS